MDTELGCCFSRINFDILDTMLHTYLNQPDRISLDSDSDPNSRNSGDFASFRNDFSTPVLLPRQMALLRATIPNVTLQVPDYSLVFFYYSTLSTATTAPTFQNLQCVRLFPRQWQLGSTKGTNMRWCNTPADLVTLLNTAAATNGDNTTNNLYWTAGDVTFAYSTTTNQITFQGTRTGYYCNAGYSDANVQLVLNGGSFSSGLTVNTTTGTNVTYGVTTNNTTGIIIGTSVTITGFGTAGYNGTFTVTAVTYNSFTVANSTQGASAGGTGTWSVPRLTMPNTGGSGTTLQPVVPSQTLNQLIGYTYSGNNLPPQSFTSGAASVFANLKGIAIANGTDVPVDSFPNLVATQCLYVYSTVFGASGNSSTGQKNLLAVIPVNAANLQVINYIPQSPLFTSTKLVQEIYSFDIEIRDDNNQLWYLPDNANVQLEIGIKYDKPMTLRHEEQYA